VIAFGAQAADQAIQLEHRRYDSQPLNSPAEDTAAFWEHFKATFGRRADDVFSDRLDPFYYIVQKRGIGEDGAEFRDYPGKAGRGAAKARTSKQARAAANARWKRAKTKKRSREA